jgi:xanthine dehydrogenase iron-sulfur cluster and FAD-binding subunit A
MCAAAKPITARTGAGRTVGKLCRCTGYRPILDAGQQQMADCRRVKVDERALLRS